MEQKRLKRSWARICWMLRLFGAGITIFGALLRGIPFLVVGCLLMGAYVAVWIIFLHCPNCGKDLAQPQWNPGKPFYCKRCGRPFLFDDDPPDKTETTTREEP